MSSTGSSATRLPKLSSEEGGEINGLSSGMPGIGIPGHLLHFRIPYILYPARRCVTTLAVGAYRYRLGCVDSACLELRVVQAHCGAGRYPNVWSFCNQLGVYALAFASFLLKLATACGSPIWITCLLLLCPLCLTMPMFLYAIVGSPSNELRKWAVRPMLSSNWLLIN